MELLERTIAEIKPAEKKWLDACWKHWDSLCKPLRGFGILEETVARIGSIQKTDRPHCSVRKTVIMGADNGVIAEGVSQCGSEVTTQVLENMGEHISSVCVMSRILNMQVLPVDIGMKQAASHPGVRNEAVRRGTGNIARENAMTPAECRRAVETGIRIARELAGEGTDLMIAGEMGIGNTTTSTACACVLFGLDPEQVTGRGAGLTSEGLERKIRVIREAIRINHPDPADPLDILHKIGGLDIAGMTGLYLGCAAAGIPILIDGAISGVAACFAAMLSPESADYMIATHATAEPIGEHVMRRLGKTPFLYAGMHLGEGTGAAACIPLIDQALNVYYGLPSFDNAHVEQYEHLK